MGVLDVVPSLIAEVRRQGRRFVEIPRELAVVAPGMAYYLATGKTPLRAYSSLRRLYYLTDGRFNDVVHGVLRRFRPPAELGGSAGVLGDMKGARLESILAAIERDGFYVFEERLPEHDVDEVYGYALRTRCIPRREDGTSAPVLFDLKTERAPRLDFDASDILACAPLQRLLVDRSILALSQAYLRSGVVMDAPTMWWSTTGSGQPSSAAAQLFHVDLDRIRWLNFSFLITDVTPKNGPHCYVRGSHRNKPAELLRDGRYSDDEIASHYPDGIVEIGGPRGTIFATDNRGFHKGKLPTEGARLLFQMVVADSQFGQNYQSVSISGDVEPALRDALERFPSTYSAFATAPRGN